MKNNIIVTQLYPSISNSMDKNINKYKKCLTSFIEKRSEQLYAIAPYDRIYFGASDIEEYYAALQITESQITEVLSKTYYWDFPSFNPAAAKDQFTIAQLCVIRYFFLKNMKKELELSTLYLAFSGKFYPSIHYGSFPKVQPLEHKHVMDYVINNALSSKYDIKSQGSIIGAIRSISNTWYNTYSKEIKEYTDEDIVYIIQQLHNRIKSFMKNIATEYYKAYDNKNQYLSYDSDNLSEDNYHLADNDSFKADRAVEKTMQYINSTGVDYRVCKMGSDSNVKTDEIKSIIESILSSNDNIDEIRELVNLIIVSYFVQSKTKDVRDISFITFSIAPKPNAKNKDILRQKEIVEGWLNENSDGYRKRRSRPGTNNSYTKSIFTYFTLMIQNANKM